MKELKLTLLRQYRKAQTEKQREAGHPGTLVYLYKVTGDQKHVDAYVESKKKDPKVKIESIKQADGQVNFFSIRALKNMDGSVPNLVETSKGEWIPDTTKADEFASLQAQYGFEMAKEMTKNTVA